MRQGTPGHKQKLQYIIQRSRIALTRFHHREELLQILPKQITFKQTFTGLHPQAVAFYGIDLSVVGHHSERLGQIPGRESIGAETRMHQSNRTLQARLLQVEVIRTQLLRREHPLVYKSLARQAGNVKMLLLPEG